MKKIGLIAGSGQFPLLFAQAAAAQGYAVYAVGHVNESDAGLAQLVEQIEWIHLGQLKRLLRFFKRHQVQEVVMLGAIRKTKLFADLRPDLKAIAMLTRMRHTHDDGVLSAFARLMEAEGLKVRPSTFLMPELLAQEGCWTRRKPSREERSDIALGWRVAKEIGRLDIGQCVVVGGGSVLAVEAIEGPDATIVRGGSLGSGSAVAVKVCKPNQDRRFDMPAVGAQTVRSMQAGGVRALAVEAGRALVFDRQEMVALADSYGMALLAITDGFK